MVVPLTLTKILLHPASPSINSSSLLLKLFISELSLLHSSTTLYVFQFLHHCKYNKGKCATEDYWLCKECPECNLMHCHLAYSFNSCNRLTETSSLRLLMKDSRQANPNTSYIGSLMSGILYPLMPLLLSLLQL